ncbi:hypothetical protein ASZ90_018665 [hydrocarbon metagenome]|uniref:Uncharacterized protein n=1 Tax=hydrocarbon metagenome TaxID=938273 RepID=A0A0W8E647_9ZZZZ
MPDEAGLPKINCGPRRGRPYCFEQQRAQIVVPGGGFFVLLAFLLNLFIAGQELL